MDTQMEKLLAAQERALQQKHEADRKEKSLRKQIAELKRKERNHRLITRGAAMESVFPDVKPLTEREFYEIVERISELPGVMPIIAETVARHHAEEKMEAG